MINEQKEKNECKFQAALHFKVLNKYLALTLRHGCLPAISHKMLAQYTEPKQNLE